MSYTLTYDQDVEGWPSFYSYDPDWMIGMNNYFYTFKGGDLYRHNSDNSNRNTFYEQWCNKFPAPKPSPYKQSNIVSVFNDAVLENKVFKTISLQGDSTWGGTYVTDLQTSGFIPSVYFEKKESAYFAFIRNDDTGQYSQRSINGIGNSILNQPAATPPYTEISFSTSPLIDIGSILSVGDNSFWMPVGSNAPTYSGPVVNIEVNIPQGINRIIIDTTALGATPPAGDINYFMYVKNSIAESHGVLGHYCVFDISNSGVSKVELFAVETEVMKSYP
jgi:hypothetical protein